MGQGQESKRYHITSLFWPLCACILIAMFYFPVFYLLLRYECYVDGVPSTESLRYLFKSLKQTRKDNVVD